MRLRDKGLRLLPDGTGWEPVFYLVYLINLFSQPFFDPSSSPFAWFFVVLLIALFLPLYFRWYWLTGRAQLRVALGIAALGFFASFINAGAVVFYIYAAYFVGVNAAPPLARRILLVLCALMVPQAFFASFVIYETAYALISFGFGFLFTIFIGVQGMIEAERTRTNRKLRLAHAEIERLATVAERERIARDLHDLLGHTLSVITLKAELATKLAERHPERAGQEMREVERISREALSEVRSAVRGYRSPDLAGALANAKLALETTGITFDYYSEALELNSAQGVTLALALREGVTNILRHAQAQSCRVRFYREGERVMLEVEDDGRGGLIREGSGLSGMRERVEGLGGTLSITSERGTRLRISLPQAQTQEESPRLKVSAA